MMRELAISFFGFGMLVYVAYLIVAVRIIRDINRKPADRPLTDAELKYANLVIRNPIQDGLYRSQHSPGVS